MSIPTGFIYMLLDSEFYALYSFCEYRGYSILSSYRDGYMILFYDFDEYNCAVSFCDEHHCLYFAYSMDLKL